MVQTWTDGSGRFKRSEFTFAYSHIYATRKTTSCPLEFSLSLSLSLHLLSFSAQNLLLVFLVFLVDTDTDTCCELLIYIEQRSRCVLVAPQRTHRLSPLLCVTTRQVDVLLAQQNNFSLDAHPDGLPIAQFDKTPWPTVDPKQV